MSTELPTVKPVKLLLKRAIASFVIVTSLWFLVWPATTVWRAIATLPNHQSQSAQQVSAIYQWHAGLAARIAPWARDRLASDRASKLHLDDISGTEWPLFGSLMFIWATDHLQQQWLASDRTQAEPKVVALEALQASVDLIVDPSQAHWVRKHWGDQYLERDNLFYRMLLIAGIDRFEALTGDQRHYDLLLRQLTSLSAELAASPFGLLDDYPQQCYPVDVLLAYAAIARAQKRLGQFDAAQIALAWRAFSQDRLDPNTSLPAYVADPETGLGIGPARGVGHSAMLIFATELWPEKGKDWYARYTEQFWQRGFFVAGFREFPKDLNAPEWMVEVDAGPIVGGLGTAANAFGLGAARANGDYARAYALAAQGLVAAWPLPDGTLLFPRALSNLSDAPYVGESAFLFVLSVPMPPMSQDEQELELPNGVWVSLLFAYALGFGLIYGGIRFWRRT